MNRQEHLLDILAEECAEVAQRASKALRFGMNDVDPTQDHRTNTERIMDEFKHIQAVMEMLEDEGLLPTIWRRDVKAIENKKVQVEKYLKYSETRGTLTHVPIAVAPGFENRSE